MQGGKDDDFSIVSFDLLIEFVDDSSLLKIFISE
jgi:hypothetical protein